MNLSILTDWVRARLSVEHHELTYEGSDGEYYYFSKNKDKFIGELSVEFNFRVSLKDGTLDIDNKKGEWIYIDKFNQVV